MTPPILQTNTYEQKREKEKAVGGAAPNHGNMSVFQLTMEGPLWGTTPRFDLGRVGLVNRL
jgi:hypothetical protein